jgi:hypothetical protein
LPTGHIAAVRLEMTLSRNLSRVIDPFDDRAKEVPQGRRTTRHALHKLSDELFGSHIHHHALFVRDLYIALWLDAVERVTGPQAPTTMNTQSSETQNAAQNAAIRATLPLGVPALTPLACAPTLARLVQAMRTPPSTGDWLASPQLAESTDRASAAFAAAIQSPSNKFKPGILSDGSIEVDIDLPTLDPTNRKDHKPAQWISSLLLLYRNKQWHSLEHEFLETPDSVTRQRLIIQPPEDAPLDETCWKNLRYIESDDGFGTEWVGIMWPERVT